jgi:hypothetical protein
MVARNYRSVNRYWEVLFESGGEKRTEARRGDLAGMGRSVLRPYMDWASVLGVALVDSELGET